MRALLLNVQVHMSTVGTAVVITKQVPLLASDVAIPLAAPLAAPEESESWVVGAIFGAVGAMSWAVGAGAWAVGAMFGAAGVTAWAVGAMFRVVGAGGWAVEPET